MRFTSTVLAALLITSSAFAYMFNDYNGDQIADLAVYESPTGNWFIRSLGPVGPANPPITFGQNWGNSTMIPVPGDYNGDDINDMAVYEITTGNWFIRSLGPVGPGFPPITFGQNWGNGDMRPVPGDYNGDGVFDLAVYERTTGNWYIRSLGPGAPITFAQNWGHAGMIPVSGDFNDDGIYDLAVFEKQTGNWFIRSLGPGPAIAFAENHYAKEDDYSDAWVIPTDHTGDGVFDLCVYEPTKLETSPDFDPDSSWHFDEVGGYGPLTYWGKQYMVPVPGDFNNDGLYDPACYNLNSGQWFIKDMATIYSNNPAPITFGQEWGSPSMVPVGAPIGFPVRFVLCDEFENVHPWNASLAADLRPAAPFLPAVKVLMGTERAEYRDTEYYNNGVTCREFDYKMDIQLKDPNSGNFVGSAVIQGDPRAICPYFIYTNNDFDKYGDHVSLADIEAWLRDFVD